MQISQNMIDSLVDFYKSGIKKDSQKLGVELEYTLVYSNGQQVKYYDEFGQKWLMEQMLETYPQKMLDEEDDLIGIKNDRDSITLEPAGQFELSAGPFENISQVDEAFSTFLRTLGSLCEAHSIQINAIGYHPTKKASELEIIPKVRYQLMNEYFEKFSPLGIRMMRATGSTQVSIDYSSVDDCIRKLRLAYLCTPIFALLCDNTPTFEGQASPHPLMRTQVWEDCDKKRCGIVPGVLDNDFTLEKYAKYVLSAPAMFEMDGNVGHVSGRPFFEIYNGKSLTFEQCANVSSHLFNDVRLKNFIEIRPADALPLQKMLGYVALVKGLFYSEQSMCAMEDLFGDVSEKEWQDAKMSLMNVGIDAEIYNKSAKLLASELLKIAERTLDGEEGALLSSFDEIVK